MGTQRAYVDMSEVEARDAEGGLEDEMQVGLLGTTTAPRMMSRGQVKTVNTLSR